MYIHSSMHVCMNVEKEKGKFARPLYFLERQATLATHEKEVSYVYTSLRPKASDHFVQQNNKDGVGVKKETQPHYFPPRKGNVCCPRFLEALLDSMMGGFTKLLDWLISCFSI